MSWQLAVIVAVAVAAAGILSSAVVRVFARSSSTSGRLRPASDVESALVGGTVPAGAHVFDGWSYRVSARFAGRVRVAVYPETVTVTGPRVPKGLYVFWIWLQTLLLAATFPALAASVVLLDWRWLVGAIALFLLSFAVSIGGAGLWPGLGELAADEPEGRFTALEFPRCMIREVDIGRGWAKGGLEIVLFPYVAGVDKMAKGRAVSFFAPDEGGHEVRVAVDMYSERKATELADLLTENRLAEHAHPADSALEK